MHEKLCPTLYVNFTGILLPYFTFWEYNFKIFKMIKRFVLTSVTLYRCYVKIQNIFFFIFYFEIKAEKEIFDK